MDDSSDAVDMVEAAETRNDAAQGRKFFRNGRLVIEKDGKAYTAGGAETK